MTLTFRNVTCSKFHKSSKLVKYCTIYVVYIYTKRHYISSKKICLDEFKLFTNSCNFVYIGSVIDRPPPPVPGTDVSKKCLRFLKMILNVLRELCPITACLSGSLVPGVWHFSAILVPECEQNRSRRGSEGFWKGLFTSFNQIKKYF